MTKIYHRFHEIADQFDVLLFDAYGVFWGGDAPIPGSLETMAEQVRRGKPLCILSNTSSVGNSTIEGYKHKGLTRGVHYTDVITSGDVCLDYLKNNPVIPAGGRVFMMGISKINLPKYLNCRVVQTPEEADFVFFGAPQLTPDQVCLYPDLQDAFYLDSCGRYDMTTIRPFKALLEKCAALNLPAISTNPDLMALEKHIGVAGATWIVRQGELSENYRRLGGQVLEFGKPYGEMFDYTFRRLGVQPSRRVAMIGDTYRTDIRGALNAGITPVWCVDTGMAKYELDHGKSLRDQAGGSLDGIVLIRQV